MPVLFKRNSTTALGGGGGGGGGGEGSYPSSSDKHGQTSSSSNNLQASLGMQFGARKPSEPDERERVLAGKIQTRNITLTERKRREDFQKKMEAATVIQRAWRR
ncbi:hypothetical protein PoB_005889900 [Plakobranchus ocellatus]|uniref:Uncharacterized protein n=1 Tax=Plakobranchus ocellatus TaxID=259542 RepID=A0AAV4CM22_9GAST|nr:hypothetical protein PoB_005889900 [Plakobranchus ocellatus]